MPAPSCPTADKGDRKTSRHHRSKSPGSGNSPTTIAASARRGRNSFGCNGNCWNWLISSRPPALSKGKSSFVPFA
jgi:hypothetical protein